MAFPIIHSAVSDQILEKGESFQHNQKSCILFVFDLVKENTLFNKISHLYFSVSPFWRLDMAFGMKEGKEVVR